ncbi:MAG: N-acetyltransferase [Clostridiales bacterium]|nr:N-acetyltransferase [Clostridiales bacterium]
MNFTIESNRIYKQDGQGKLLAEVLFPENAGGMVTVTHTFVDESLRGQGIADELMKALVSEVILNNKKISPVCSYAVKWFSKHPEHSDLLV